MTVDGVTHPLAAAVHGDRDPEPDRARGHLSPARGAARPLPHAHRDGLPGPRRRGRDPRGAGPPVAVEELEPVTTADEIAAATAAFDAVHVRPSLRNYIVDLADATRRHPDLALGASPRGALALQRAARVLAATPRARLRAARRREAARARRARAPPAPHARRRAPRASPPPTSSRACSRRSRSTRIGPAGSDASGLPPARLTRRGWTLTGAGVRPRGHRPGSSGRSSSSCSASSRLVLLGGLAALGPRASSSTSSSCGRSHPARVHVGGDARVDLEVRRTAGRGPTPAAPVDRRVRRRPPRGPVPPPAGRAPTTPARAAYRVPTNRRGPLHARADLADASPIRSASRRRPSELGADRRGHRLPARRTSSRAAARRAGRLPSASPFAVRAHAVDRRRRRVPDPARVRGRRRPRAGSTGARPRAPASSSSARTTS